MMNRPVLNDEGEKTLSRAMAPLRTAPNDGKLPEHSSREQKRNDKVKMRAAGIRGEAFK
jgi:hypothetical protein